MVSDPKMFCNVSSTYAAIQEMRATSTLPTVFDDDEGEKMQNKAMTGSMNGASKFSKTDGEEQILGGIIYTKNLKINEKIPPKISGGTNNWLLMDRDEEYEIADIAETCDSDYEHINQMKSIEMPRDCLASLTKYFFPNDSDSTSFFQEAHKEAVQILKARRNKWTPRKIKSAALFLSIFMLIRRRVEEENDESVSKLYVEVFKSQETFEDLLMQALDKTEEVEQLMTEEVRAPVSSVQHEEIQEKEINKEAFSPDELINEIVKDTLSLVENLNEVELSKYVKLFHSESTTLLGIQQPKVKMLAKQKKMQRSQISAHRVRSTLPMLS